MTYRTLGALVPIPLLLGLACSSQILVPGTGGATSGPGAGGALPGSSAIAGPPGRSRRERSRPCRPCRAASSTGERGHRRRRQRLHAAVRRRSHHAPGARGQDLPGPPARAGRADRLLVRRLRGRGGRGRRGWRRGGRPWRGDEHLRVRRQRGGLGHLRHRNAGHHGDDPLAGVRGHAEHEVPRRHAHVRDDLQQPDVDEGRRPVHPTSTGCSIPARRPISTRRSTSSTTPSPRRTRPVSPRTSTASTAAPASTGASATSPSCPSRPWGAAFWVASMGQPQPTPSIFNRIDLMAPQ